ncbi:Uncharacterised protein [Candidatus Norongarragalina meridionalis]|nr:Uncharacterised protein [Candidatus Norongarragalina meridionalis]
MKYLVTEWLAKQLKEKKFTVSVEKYPKFQFVLIKARRKRTYLAVVIHYFRENLLKEFFQKEKQPERIAVIASNERAAEKMVTKLLREFSRIHGLKSRIDD